MSARFEDGLAADNYHAVRALSKSGVGALIDECPAKYWWSSPFNADYEREQKTTFDMGTAAHLIFLEPDLFLSRTLIIEAGDYKTKAAQEARDNAYLTGLTPLLEKQAQELVRMRDALFTHPLAKSAFRDGVAERSYFWTDPEFGVECKARPDWLSEKHGYVVDYKTSTSAHPAEFAKRVWDHHYFVQHPWYLEGIEAAGGRKFKFLFVVQEKVAPYLVSVFELDWSTIDWGRKYARKAKQIFARCLERNEWPGYRDPAHPDVDRMIPVALPSYAQFQLADRDERDEFFTGEKHRLLPTKTARLIYQGATE